MSVRGGHLLRDKNGTSTVCCIAEYSARAELTAAVITWTWQRRTGGESERPDETREKNDIENNNSIQLSPRIKLSNEVVVLVSLFRASHPKIKSSPSIRVCLPSQSNSAVQRPCPLALRIHQHQHPPVVQWPPSHLEWWSSIRRSRKTARRWRCRRGCCTWRGLLGAWGIGGCGRMG